MFLAMLAGLLVGVPAGVGMYTFIYARGASYLTNDPSACANCHVMQNHYAAWMKSSHRTAAACNDCHTPASLIPKYLVKGNNGFWHSFAFTTQRFHEPIQIKPGNLRVTENACRKCHSNIVDAIEGPHNEVGKISCVKCHSTVGHVE